MLTKNKRSFENVSGRGGGARQQSAYKFMCKSWKMSADVGGGGGGVCVGGCGDGGLLLFGFCFCFCQDINKD